MQEIRKTEIYPHDVRAKFCNFDYGVEYKIDSDFFSPGSVGLRSLGERGLPGLRVCRGCA